RIGRRAGNGPRRGRGRSARRDRRRRAPPRRGASRRQAAHARRRLGARCAARDRRAPRMRDPRRDALEILVRVEEGAFLDALVGRALEPGGLAPRDAGLLTRLAYGVEAWRARLDWTLAPLVRDGLGSLEPRVRAALRLGL